VTDRELIEAAPKASGLDPTGKKYGRLLVLSEVARTDPKKRRFLCLCDCGQRTERNLNALRTGHVRSCGCLHIETLAENRTKGPRGQPPKHGKHGTPEYGSWISMRQRCNNPKKKCFEHYGGRGIKVCERWDAFANFLQDMGPRPEGHSLDRIDVNGNYEPGNVRWATQQQQLENTRVAKLVTIDGRTQTIAAWSREKGLNLGQVQQRISYGWTLEDAILTPSGRPGVRRAAAALADAAPLRCG
jgi:hypothetical protein